MATNLSRAVRRVRGLLALPYSFGCRAQRESWVRGCAEEDASARLNRLGEFLLQIAANPRKARALQGLAHSGSRRCINAHWLFAASQRWETAEAANQRLLAVREASLTRLKPFGVKPSGWALGEALGLDGNVLEAAEFTAAYTLGLCLWRALGAEFFFDLFRKGEWEEIFRVSEGMGNALKEPKGVRQFIGDQLMVAGHQNRPSSTVKEIIQLTRGWKSIEGPDGLEGMAFPSTQVLVGEAVAVQAWADWPRNFIDHEKAGWWVQAGTRFGFLPRHFLRTAAEAVEVFEATWQAQAARSEELGIEPALYLAAAQWGPLGYHPAVVAPNGPEVFLLGRKYTRWLSGQYLQNPGGWKRRVDWSLAGTELPLESCWQLEDFLEWSKGGARISPSRHRREPDEEEDELVLQPRW